MAEYASNSHKSKEQPPEKKVEKVVTGNVVAKKKSAGHKLAETFLSSDISDVKSYVLMDVIIPAIKNTISDALCNGIEMLFNGETRGRKTVSTNGRPSYANYYTSKNSRQPVKANTSSRRSPDDIIFESRAEADEVLGHLIEMIDTYGMASVADLYELAGLDTSYTDNNYGWVDLGSSNVIRTRDGYLLKLPRTVDLR